MHCSTVYLKILLYMKSKSQSLFHYKSSPFMFICTINRVENPCQEVISCWDVTMQLANNNNCILHLFRVDKSESTILDLHLGCFPSLVHIMLWNTAVFMMHNTYTRFHAIDESFYCIEERKCWLIPSVLVVWKL